tara:strand:+ start:31225 stop:32304 length:1080 start_codon:yes stop_codon:yes gene_type:complete
VSGIARLIGVLALTFLAACSDRGEPAAAQFSSKSVMAPFEEGGWPEYLRRLDLKPGKDYVILAYVPPANPIDLSSPEKARGTLARLVFDQLGAMEAGTTIGHLIVGWQCGGVRGMTSMTGEQDLQGQRMFLTGWGVTPILSTFFDGDIVPLAEFPEAQNRALTEGRGVVVASEVSAARCAAARAEVAEFETHPDAPHENYSLVLRPDLYEGGGCLSFAMHVAAKAGVMPRLPALVRRDVDLRAVQLGAREVAPAQVDVYRAPGHPEAPVGWLEVLLRRWDEGPVIDTVTVPSGEAIMAALVYAGVGVQAKTDPRYSRILSRDDPVIGAAATYGLQWGYSYPVRRISDPGGVRAVVLERS